MTLPDFSVLLLAWDEADPRVAVLGGMALPPTLPLVYHLAAQQPVLAVYPHLPETAELPADDCPPQPTPEDLAADEAVILTPEPDTATVATPGIRRLPAAALAAHATGAPASHLAGLDELSVSAGTSVPAAPDALPTASAQATARARSQWPTGIHAPQRPHWEAPAAPYAGASPAPPRRAVLQPVPTPRRSPSVREAADLAQAARSGAPEPSLTPAPVAPATGPLSAADAAQDLTLEQPAMLPSEVFDEPIEEIGPTEAYDLSAPEDDLTLQAPPPNSEPPGVPPVDPAPAPVLRVPELDGLNFRMIQYARQAAQLVRGHADFGVIYAPNWPAWLAALEIRTSSGLPLVLYAADLVNNFAPLAERGWLLEVERMALRRAHLILVPTAALRQQLHEQYAADSIGEVRVVAAEDEEAVQALLGELAAG